MRNRLGSLIICVLLMLVVGFLLVKSIRWFLVNIAQQEVSVQEKVQVLKNEVNSTYYFQSQGINVLTPELIINYDKAFGTNLFPKINFKVDRSFITPPISVKTTKPMAHEAADTFEAGSMYSVEAQPSIYQASGKLKAGDLMSGEKLTAAALNEKTANIMLIQTAPLTALEEPIQKSQSELQKLSEMGEWQKFASMTPDAVGIWFLIVFFTNLINRISDDCYSVIKTMGGFLMRTIRKFCS